MKEQACSSALSVHYDLVWDHLDAAQKGDAMAMGEDYKQFLDAAKTERLCVKEIGPPGGGEGICRSSVLDHPLPRG